MIEGWANNGFYIAVWAAALALAALIQRPSKPRYLFIGLALAAADLILVALGPIIQTSSVPNLHWNWIGKGASIAFTAALLAVSPSLRTNCGLTLAQNSGSLKWSIGLSTSVAALLAFFVWQEPSEPYRSETLLYELLMPTLAEELTYRGTFLCVLNRAWDRRHRWLGLPINWPAIICTILFGCIHGFAWHDGVQFEFVPLLYTTIVGSILMFIRLRTGSLVFPMVLHSLLNLINVGLPMLH